MKTLNNNEPTEQTFLVISSGKTYTPSTAMVKNNIPITYKLKKEKIIPYLDPHDHKNPYIVHKALAGV